MVIYLICLNCEYWNVQLGRRRPTASHNVRQWLGWKVETHAQPLQKHSDWHWSSLMQLTQTSTVTTSLLANGSVLLALLINQAACLYNNIIYQALKCGLSFWLIVNKHILVPKALLIKVQFIFLPVSSLQDWKKLVQ